MKIVFLRARVVLPILAVGLALCAWILVAKPGFITAMAGQRQLPIYCVQREYKVVSLTFDAAWGNEDTLQLIDILGKHNVSATFFVVGDWARKYPESVRQLFDAGHEVMSHSNHHDHMTKLTKEQIVADLMACNQDIEAITGVSPTLFRCPYGEYDDKVVLAVRGMGMEVVQWDVDSLDWMDKTAGEITSRVTKKTQPGSIVLFHNAAKYTPDALDGLITTLTQQGYSFAKVSDLILDGETAIDHTGRQMPAKPSPSGPTSTMGARADRT